MDNFWVNFWSVFFFVSLGIFALLAVVVTIGGFFNILSLLATLAKEHKNQKNES